MSEELGLHTKLTASAGNIFSVMDQLLNKLIQLEQESKLLKKSQKEIEKEIGMPHKDMRRTVGKSRG